MKDNIPTNLPPIDSLVAWRETCVTSQGILSHRMVWGQVREHAYNRTGMYDGPAEGYYVHVFLLDGSDLFIHVNDILLVQP